MYTFMILWLRSREYFTLFLKGYYLLSKAKNEWLKEPTGRDKDRNLQILFPPNTLLFIFRENTHST